ncbi:hypothetical protein B0H17DRAFT_1215620 [Mycena rosella]|uniref:Uncharacterized protein n=1 Tax=Mycena rosella TaxID=1033263 RepID=A0AAD7G0X4_MYCRO|nr:hypothetical protein B0H17DRAFT_1215620 [Mycena rosella]
MRSSLCCGALARGIQFHSFGSPADSHEIERLQGRNARPRTARPRQVSRRCDSCSVTLSTPSSRRRSGSRHQDRASHHRRVDLHTPPPLLCKISSWACHTGSISQPPGPERSPTAGLCAAIHHYHFIENIGLVPTRPPSMITLVSAKIATDRRSILRAYTTQYPFQSTKCFSRATRPNRRYSRLPLAPLTIPIPPASSSPPPALRASEARKALGRRGCACMFFHCILRFASEGLIFSVCAVEVAMLCGVPDGALVYLPRTPVNCRPDSLFPSLSRTPTALRAR